MSNPDNRTQDERDKADRLHLFINVKTVWAEVLARWAFTRTRLDQAIHDTTAGAKRTEWVKAEVRYGARTVRVVLLKGDSVLGMWDLQSDATHKALDEFLAEFEAELRKLGIEPK